MRRGCIAVGLINCNNCGKIIDQGDRYLILEEDTEPKQRICLDCCEKLHYGRYEIEKGERIFTLLVDEMGNVTEQKKAEKKKPEEEAAEEAKPEKESGKKQATAAPAEKKATKKKGAGDK